MATCFASYGTVCDAPIEGWVRVKNRIQESLGIRFSEGYWSREGKSRHGSVEGVERAASRALPDAVTFLERPRGPFLASDWTTCLTISRYPCDVVFVGLRHEWKLTDLFGLASEATALLGDLIYAIGYCREMDRGPQAFAFGMNHTIGSATISTAEADRNTLWFDDISFPAKNRYTAGYLRDVFPCNLLSAVHGKITVEGASLLSWVKKYGSVQELGDERFVWVLEDDEIPPIRKVLERNRVLLSRDTPYRQ